MQYSFHEFIKQCRINANFSVDKAAFELNICRRTLNYYENGTVAVPDDVAYSMAILYKTPVIKYLWLKNSKCGNELPNIWGNNLSEKILSLAVNLKISNDCLHELMTIGLDGEISTEEKPKYNKIINKLWLLSKDILLLRFLPNKKAEPLNKQSS